ncbi:unnamed protein product, partial [Anisakis simplex]|uniref:Cullin-5 n=1 Tax=Anisakis simplex TaxID=6269 RepID=A0A0M3KIH5_ANISI
MLYRLIKRTPNGIQSILDYLDEFIRTEALNDMMANAATITTDPEKYVEQLLSMFSRFSALVASAFYDDPRFLTARDKAFQDVVNDTCIFKMEIASSKSKQNEMVLLVLKYVSNKDVFMRFHKAHLARRLILEMSADQEKEENMVTRLRDAGMPADFVNKLYRMLQDIEVNKDLNAAFKKSIGSNNNCIA